MIKNAVTNPVISFSRDLQSREALKPEKKKKMVKQSPAAVGGAVFLRSDVAKRAAPLAERARTSSRTPKKPPSICGRLFFYITQSVKFRRINANGQILPYKALGQIRGSHIGARSNSALGECLIVKERHDFVLGSRAAVGHHGLNLDSFLVCDPPDAQIYEGIDCAGDILAFDEQFFRKICDNILRPFYSMKESVRFRIIPNRLTRYPQMNSKTRQSRFFRPSHANNNAILVGFVNETRVKIVFNAFLKLLLRLKTRRLPRTHTKEFVNFIGHRCRDSRFSNLFLGNGKITFSAFYILRCQILHCHTFFTCHYDTSFKICVRDSNEKSYCPLKKPYGIRVFRVLGTETVPYRGRLYIVYYSKIIFSCDIYCLTVPILYFYK